MACFYPILHNFEVVLTINYLKIAYLSCVCGRLLDDGTGHNGSKPSEGKILLVQATGGIVAGASASCITTPLDTIKTRLQVFWPFISIVYQL